MIQSFNDDGTEAVFNGVVTKKARKVCPIGLWDVAARKLDHLDSAVRVEDLKAPPGNRLEKLSGDRRGQHSIRINERYRICFTWSEGGPTNVEIVDYHK